MLRAPEHAAAAFSRESSSQSRRGEL